MACSAHFLTVVGLLAVFVSGSKGSAGSFIRYLRTLDYGSTIELLLVIIAVSIVGCMSIPMPGRVILWSISTLVALKLLVDPPKAVNIISINNNEGSVSDMTPHSEMPLQRSAAANDDLPLMEAHALLSRNEDLPYGTADVFII